MKKISTLLRPLLLGAISIVMVACGKSGAGGDYRNLIPDDAFMTMSFNVQSMMDKAGFSDAERAALKGQAEMAMMFMGGTLSEDDKKFILSIIDSPDNSGLSFNSNVYLSMSIEGSDYDDVRVAFISKISDSKKFDRLISLLGKIDPAIQPKSDGGLNVISIDSDPSSTTLLAYDKNAAMMYVHQGDYAATMNYVKELFKGTHTILDNKELSKFAQAKSDLGFLMNYGPVVEMISDQLPAGLPYMEILANARIYANTNFEKGKIITEGGFVFTDKAAEKEFLDFYGDAKISGKYSKYISENALAAFAGYLDGAKIYDMLVKMPETSSMVTIPQVKTILEALEGEILLSLSNIWAPQLSAAVLATVNDKDILDYIVSQLGFIADIKKLPNGYYATDLEGLTVTFGQKDDMLFVVTDPEVLAALDGKSMNGPDKDVVSMFDKGTGAVYVDIAGLAGAVLDTYWYGGYVDQGTAMVLDVVSLFKDVRIHSTDTREFTMTVIMEDAGQNALTGIADKIREIAMGAMLN